MPSREQPARKRASTMTQGAEHNEVEAESAATKRERAQQDSCPPGEAAKRARNRVCPLVAETRLWYTC